MNSLRKCHWLVVVFVLMLAGCISPDNATVEGTGTPDITQCGNISGVADGKDFEPQKAVVHGADGRTYPDLFYIAWAHLDSRTDLRFPARGYDAVGYEDKLLVSRLNPEGTKYDSWQVWPPKDNDCKDTEKVRIHSFDVAPDGKSLFISMSREEMSNPKRKLGIYRLDIASQTLTKISKDNSVDFMNPAYIGNDPTTNHEILLVAKTVQDNEIPINYAARSVLEDEYDRHPTPLIHKMDTQTGDTIRIGFNNSHQTEPSVVDGPSGGKLVIFNQWEHQDAVNRFSLWKMQIDGSDNFTYFGQESSTDRSKASLYAPRAIRSGPYKGYILMGQGARTNHGFAEEGHILMTNRTNLDLRSDKIFLEKLVSNGVDQNISRTPEHYNDQSFTYAYRATVDNTYGIYVKDYPATISVSAPLDNSPGKLVISNNNYHFMQPRSFYPPASKVIVPSEGDLDENRVSFTNNHLGEHRAGFLVENITMSDNGAQHQVGNPQIGNILPSDLRLQFFIPSHHFADSNAIGMKNSQEMIIPASDFIEPESDGSLGVILKTGLYTWRLHKRFSGAGSDRSDVWVPIRAERQEVSFVKNRVNGCNQCHMERSEERNLFYANKNAIATQKMRGDLSTLLGSDKDISQYNSANHIPDFYNDIIPLLKKQGNVDGKSCMDCHNARDKLDLANTTGISNINPTYRNLLLGAHSLSDNTGVVPFVDNSINPMGAEDSYHKAPFLWSLLLNDDLTVPPDANHPNESSRVLNRAGDYGAVYNTTVATDIANINNRYDHSKHWSSADIQKFITYTTTQIPVGLSNKLNTTFQESSISRTTPQAQKAYQAMVRQCFACHTSNLTEGIKDTGFGLPWYKRFISTVWLSDPDTRFVVKTHLENKGDDKYSPYPWISDLVSSMDSTLASASQRIDFNTPNESELLVYARGGKNADGSANTLHTNVSTDHIALSVTSDDYKAIENWVKNTAGITNQPPTIDTTIPNITLKEYDDPAFLRIPYTNDDLEIQWHDTDGDYSQPFINGSGTATHSFNDTMLALKYLSFNSAKLKAYAILGDRTTNSAGVTESRNFEFTVTDGLSSSEVQKVPVTVTSDYQVPRPSTQLPASSAFYTERATGILHKLNTMGGDTVVGTGAIPNYNGETWTTMYRRADKGWLYFVEQTTQRIHVVDETNANYLFSITLDHTPNKDSDTHKQTVSLIWWRPAEGILGTDNYRAGELQGLLESKLSKHKNGDFYVGLGDGEAPISGTDKVVVPQYRTKLVDGGNTVGVYVWRRATFMTKWNNDAADEGAIDRVNVLNLETGKAKPLASYSFTEKTVGGVTYPEHNYLNVRAIVVAEDGAFYGFNKNLNQNVEIFNYDPLLGIQQPVTNIPTWIGTLINDPIKYATPFVVIDKRPVTP